MDSELDDLDGLVNFFAGAAGDAAAEQAQNVVVGPLQQQEQDDGDDVPDDLLQMVEIAADVPRRAHERRSWQLLQHARSCKQKKRLHGQVAQREKRAKRAESLGIGIYSIIRISRKVQNNKNMKKISVSL